MTARLDVSGIFRRVRRQADFSQRELAQAIGVSRSEVGRVEESGRIRIELLERALAVAGLRLAVVDADGGEVQPMRKDGVRDMGGRRMPAHLDPFAYYGWWVPFRADRPYPRPTGSASYHQRQPGRERPPEGASTIDDHPSREDLLPVRRRPGPRYVTGWECLCGPECELLCVGECECQCEPTPELRRSA